MRTVLRSRLVVPVLLLMIAGVWGPPRFVGGGALTPAEAQALSQGTTERVIVLFQNQHVPSMGLTTRAARTNAIQADQAPVLSELSQVNASNIKPYHLINAIAASVTPAEQAHLQTDAGVLAVLPDRTVRELKPHAGPSSTIKHSHISKAAIPTVPEPSPVCSSTPSLEPEALQQTNTAFSDPSIPQASSLENGSGVTVAFLADGIDPANPDFQRSGSSAITDYEDFSGDGLDAPTAGGEAFLDASSIVAQGKVTYNISPFINPSFSAPPVCNIKIRGMAPGADVMALKVFNSAGDAWTSALIEAVQYAADNGAQVINESLGSNPYPDISTDPFRMADDAAVQDYGITVVAAAGDEGPFNTLSSPSTDPNVIAAGATTTFRSYAQVGLFGIQLGSGSWTSNNVSGFSSSGLSEDGKKTVDVVAGGDLGWAVCTPDATYSDCPQYPTDPQPPVPEIAGGTSESSPLVAGEIALVIEAYRQTHGGVAPTPAVVRQLIMGTASDLGYPSQEQGAGMIDSLHAVRAAESFKDSNGSPVPIGVNVLASPTVLSAEGAPNTSETFPLTVTNDSATGETVSPSVRALAGPFSTIPYNLTLDPATDPTFVDWNGEDQAYVTQNVTVIPRTQRLEASISWDVVRQPFSLVQLDLFDPSGSMVAYDFPGDAGDPFTSSGYGKVDVANPTPGVWRAVIWTVADGSENSYTGRVHLTVAASRFSTPYGPVSSAFIGPGQSHTFTLNMHTPPQPGDQNADVVLTATAPHQATTTAGIVPVILRSDIPTTNSGGLFSGTLYGTEGVIGSGGQMQAYRFAVRAGANDLSLGIKLRDSSYNLAGFLVDPSNNVVDAQSTITALEPAPGFPGAYLPAAYTNAMQFFRREPAAGMWTFILTVDDNVSGAQTSIPFSGQIQFNAVSVSSTVPHAATTRLTAAPHTYTLTVRNTGNTTKSYFVDARGAGTTTYSLPDLFDENSDVTLPFQSPAPFGPAPGFIVPPESSKLEVTSTATPSSIPLTTEITYDGGSAPNGVSGVPDIVGGSNPASVSLQAPEVPFGAWTAIPEELGNTNAGGAPGTANVVGDVVTQPFDRTVTASYKPSGGPSVKISNEWDILINNSSQSFNPLTLAPGQAGTITITITPTASSGTEVKGNLYVDTLALSSGTDVNNYAGDEVSRIPYDYTVQ